MDDWICGSLAGMSGPPSSNPETHQSNNPTFLRETPGAVLLSVKLQPRASKNEIGERLGDELKIKVTAPPVDAAANEALVRLLTEKLDCPRGRIELIRGHKSRHKVLKLHGLSPAGALEKLTAVAGRAE